MHELHMGLKVEDEANPPYVVERRDPRWWGARLRLSGRSGTPSEGEDSAPVWLYVMGAPDDGAGPTSWPRHWGTAQGDPTPHMTGLAGTAGWFELAADRCAWSLWLDLAINCWQGSAEVLSLLRRARAEARRGERRQQRRAYCVAAQPFEAFLQQVVHPKPVLLDPDAPPVTLIDGRGADQSRVTVCKTLDAGLVLRFVPLDFGGPLPPDVEYHLDADAVALARMELGLLAGEVFDDPQSFVRVMHAQFDDLRQGLRWLREAGIWRSAGNEGGPD